MTYDIRIENGCETLPELHPLYAAHYAEMAARMEASGIPMGPFNMYLPEYRKAWEAGHLINYVARKDGKAVGYCNMYLTNSMHNMEYMGQEDALYVAPEHRNGLGRRLIKFVLADMKGRGVKCVAMGSATDMRFIKMLNRMNFKEAAVHMIYTFDKES